jgi:undecaprenyl-diphosphatase
LALGYGEAAILGIVQGLTEFLPISSSAHLRVVGELLPSGVDPGAAFTAVTQLGTETAVILYFWRDIWTILRTWTLSLFRPELRSDPAARMGWFVIVGTIPIGVLGLLFEDSIDSTVRDLRLIACMLIGFGILLGLADRYARNRRNLDELTLKHGAYFGLAQALALIPGVSRSGGTITGGLLMGYTRAAAARYSFLLAIPAVMTSGIFKLFDIGDDTAPAWGPTIFATVVAFGVGFAVIAWFLRYISSERSSFLPFVLYRVAAGVAILVLVQTGALTP